MIAKGLVLDKGTYLRSRWNVFFLVLLILRYKATNFLINFIFSFMIYVDSQEGMTFFLCIRLLNPIRIIIIFPLLQKTLNSFLKALIDIYKVFLSLLCLMLFYSLFGLYLFYGLEENRCRSTSTPPPNSDIWHIANEPYPSLCGNWQCLDGS